MLCIWQIWGVLMPRKLTFCWRLFDLLYYAISGLHPLEIRKFMAYFVYYMVLTYLVLKMTTAQVVEMSVTVNSNSPIQNYVITRTIMLNLLMK